MPEHVRVFLSRFVALFRREHLDRELEDELEFHLEMQIQNNLQNGMNMEEARRAAMSALGGLDQVKEACRDKRSLRFVEDFIQDFRYGFRILYRNPVFALTAVLTLALGIGANTAIFSVVNAVLLHPLPFAHSEDLVQIKANWAGFGINPLFDGSEFLAFYENAKEMPEIAAYSADQGNLSGTEGAERVMVGRASTGFFPLLGVQPAMGRIFVSGEDQPGTAAVALLSNDLWKKHFGGNPAILGASLLLDGAAYSVIGILPAFFDIPNQPKIDIWKPVQLNKTDKYGQRSPVALIGRLKPSGKIQAAQAELDSIYQAIHKSRTQDRVVVSKWEEAITQDARLPLLLFLGAVGFVLLIACANVANLLLTRAATREREMAIRAAVGASRMRIVRQILTESLLIALVGGGLGLVLTIWARVPLCSLVSKNLVRIPVIPVDRWVLGFTLSLSLGTTIVAGIAPALQISRAAIGEFLKEGRRSAIGPALYQTRRLFVAMEIALVVVLLTGSGLLLKSLLILRQIDPGFQSENILSMSIDLTSSKYPTSRAQSAYFEQALELLKTHPGVESVAASACLPFGNFTMTATGIEIEGLTRETPDDESISIAPVSDGYFRTMHIPLLQGRLFAPSDGEKSGGVAILDNNMVRRYFSNQNPIGRQINLFKHRWTIVGVVRDVYQHEFERKQEPQIYLHYLQLPYPIPRMSIVARCSRNPMELAAQVRDVLKGIDPDQPAFDIMTLKDRLSGSLRGRRTNFSVIGSFAALALLMAFIGVYGVVSFSVSRRAHEIGIRMALGASKSNVLVMIIRESMSICLVGLLVGVAGALLATRIISSLLYKVSATDPLIFAAALLFVSVVVLIASYIPARRVATTDPARSLRYE
jgi:predicted permease